MQNTPAKLQLGQQTLPIVRLKGREALSKDFHFEAECLCVEPLPQTLAGERVTLLLKVKSDSLSYHGFIFTSQCQYIEHGYRYSFVVHSGLARLKSYANPQSYLTPTWLEFLKQCLGGCCDDWQFEFRNPMPAFSEQPVHFPGLTQWDFLQNILQQYDLHFYVEARANQNYLILFKQFNQLPCNSRVIDLNAEAYYQQTNAGLQLQAETADLSLRLGHVFTFDHGINLPLPQEFAIAAISYQYDGLMFINQLTLMSVDNKLEQLQTITHYDKVLPAKVVATQNSLVQVQPHFDSNKAASMLATYTTPASWETNQISTPMPCGTNVAVGFVDGDFKRPIILGSLDIASEESPSFKMGRRDEAMLELSNQYQLTVQHKEQKEITALRSNSSDLIIFNPQGSVQITSPKVTWHCQDRMNLTSHSVKVSCADKLNFVTETMVWTAKQDVQLAANNAIVINVNQAKLSITGQWQAWLKNNWCMKANQGQIKIQQQCLVQAKKVKVIADRIKISAGSSYIELSTDKIKFKSNRIHFASNAQCHIDGEIQIS